MFLKTKKKNYFILFFGVKMTPLIRFILIIMQEYDSKCLKMYLITLKVFKNAPITKGSQMHLALAHWK
jgi:hypothetical protein